MARYLTANNPVKYWKQTGQDVVDGYVYRQCMWKNGHGLVANGSTKFDGGLHGIGILQLDGTFCPRVTGVDGRWGWHDSYELDEHPDILMKATHSIYWGDSIDPVDLRSLLSGFSEYTVAWKDWPAQANHAMIYVTDYPHNDGSRYILYMEAGNKDIYRGEHLGWGFYWWHKVAEVTIDPLPPGPPTFSFRSGRLLYCIYYNGQGFLYDTGTNTVTYDQIYIDDLSGFWNARTTYCREHDIWLSVCQEMLDGSDTIRAWEDPDLTWGTQFIDRPTSLRVYVNEGVPTGIGPITMDPDPAEVGQVSTVSVYLYGAQGEPVENERVNWSIVEGGGALTSSQSITNDLGIATTGYVPPLVPESVKIHAEVAY